ncbi:MAG: hypothetical protein IJO08_04225 [Clostridia bacterium]|nr:hypothetical protein [Clostridia bacterium]
MKKIITVLLSIMLIIIIILGTLFVIDKNRMDNNLPVLFSTWGYDYAPPVNHEDITEKIPNISGEDLPVTIHLKENEDLLINLLAGWTYKSVNEEPERYEYVIAFYSPNGENKMSLRAYKDMFGVCGTELEIKDITLDIGNTASVGYYDGSERWTFVNFGDNVVMHSESYLTPEEANEALSMIKTMKFVRTLPGNIAVTERTFVATILEEENDYLIVKPDEKSIEAQTTDEIKVLLGVTGVRDYLYGEGRKVIIKYNPIIQASAKNEVITIEDIILDGYLDYELTVVESENNVAKKILNNKELCDLNTDFDLYYYGLEEVNVKVDNKEMNLEEALRSGYITLEGMIKRARKDAEETKEKHNELGPNQSGTVVEEVKTYRDGGTIELSYDDGGTSEWANIKYTIIKCRRLDGNKDMYICKSGTNLNDLDF